MENLQDTEDLSQGLEPIFITHKEQVKPKTNKSYPRLYGHHLCPFVEKARLALAARNIEYQKCDIDLEQKPQWHIDINGGTVPFLELPNGEFVLSSTGIMDYINISYPDQGYSTVPEDHHKMLEFKSAIEQLDKHHPAYYPIYFKKFSFNDEDVKNLQKKLQNIEDYLKVQFSHLSSMQQIGLSDRISIRGKHWQKTTFQ
eukprot:403343735